MTRLCTEEIEIGNYNNRRSGQLIYGYQIIKVNITIESAPPDYVSGVAFVVITVVMRTP